MELDVRILRVTSLRNRNNCVFRQLFLCCLRSSACGPQAKSRPKILCIPHNLYSKYQNGCVRSVDLMSFYCSTAMNAYHYQQCIREIYLLILFA
jgi:hypothetical protein